MFVTVLMTNCQVSLQWKSGPLASQRSVTAQISMNAWAEPDALADFSASVSNQCFLVMCRLLVADVLIAWRVNLLNLRLLRQALVTAVPRNARRNGLKRSPSRRVLQVETACP